MQESRGGSSGRPSRFKRGSGGMTNTVWKFEQLRAGKVYSSAMFDTREEAELFAAQMRKTEPDLFFRIEPVEARLVWN